MGEDVEFPHNHFERDKASNEGRPYVTLKGQEKTALGYACEVIFGSSSPENFHKMRMSLSQGLDKKAMDTYRAKVDNIVAKGGNNG